MRGGRLGEREQRQTEVAQLGEQAVKGGLVDDGTFGTVVPSLWVVMVIPSNQAAHRAARCPLSRISYRPGLCWWPADESFIVLLPYRLSRRVSGISETAYGLTAA